MAAAMTGRAHALAVAELGRRGALVVFAPRLAAKLVPYAVLALAVFGLILAKDYHDGFTNQVLYGLVHGGRRTLAALGSSCPRPRSVRGPRPVAAASRSTRRAPGWSGR